MNYENDSQYVRIKKSIVLIAIVVIAAGLFGWWIGQADDKPSPVNQTSNNTVDTTDKTAPSESTAGMSVKSLVKYTLPDGWKESTCPASESSIYIVPSGANVDCDANPSSPVKISVDPGNNTDCNQLQGVQNVSKHICISEFINGKKSLKAETVYNSESSYKKPTTINAYYINTGKGVIKVEYIHDASDNEYQAGFEQLAKSVQVK